MEENLIPGVKDFQQDVAERHGVGKILDGLNPEAIINFAAETHVDRSLEDDAPFWRSNVMGARILAEEAARRGIRLVQVSTDEVYGDGVLCPDPWPENAPLNPGNPYAVTKAAADMMLSVYARRRDHPLDVVITRGTNTIGPRQFPEKALPKAIWCFLNDRPFPLFQTPARRIWMSVYDHARGVEAALQRGIQGQIYHLVPEPECEEYTQRVIESVQEMLGKGEISLVPDRQQYDLRYRLDSTKTRLDLGWQPRWRLEDTLRETVDWYLENRDWLEKAYRKTKGELI
jgi:dTDP-glucose 4,6-dehydratase